MKIVRPVLLVNKDQVLNNIKKIHNKVKNTPTCFRPHFKTHQSSEIGSWFRDQGITQMTVSSVDMAMYFADHGWQDILIAFPVNILEINDINKLAKKINLGLLAESIETLTFLGENLTAETDIWIKIDTGYQRTGIISSEREGIFALIKIVDNYRNLCFKGILTHAGHSYKSKNAQEVLNIHSETAAQMHTVKNYLAGSGISPVLISIGDTPSCSLVSDFTDIDEIRCGNFVFYDLTQQAIGACQIEEIAVTMACPVVAKHESRMEIVIYGGAVHFSKEHILNNRGEKIFGRVVASDTDGKKLVENTYLAALSQEHGIIRSSKKFFYNTEVGDIVYLLPVHSCLTANLMEYYLSEPGGKIIRTIKSR